MFLATEWNWAGYIQYVYNRDVLNMISEVSRTGSKQTALAEIAKAVDQRQRQGGDVYMMKFEVYEPSYMQWLATQTAITADDLRVYHGPPAFQCVYGNFFVWIGMLEFNDVRLQYEQLKKEIDAAATQVLAGGRYILGKAVQSFEENFARYCGAASGIGVASGTDALKIGLAALKIGPGDEVLVPAVSAPATAMAVAVLRAKPVFVDIRPDDFTMDPEMPCEAQPAHTRDHSRSSLRNAGAPYGSCQAGMLMIEDAAQAHGSDAAWGRCGSSGIAAAFSFYPRRISGHTAMPECSSRRTRRLPNARECSETMGSGTTTSRKSPEKTAGWMRFMQRF